MHRLISKIVSEIKSEHWEFDMSIPSSYLLFFLFRKFIMYLRGLLSFWKFNKVILVGRNCTILCKSKFNIYGSVIIDKNCHIDALSYNGIVIGKNVSIGKYTTIECSGSLKNIGNGLEIGDNVGLGTHGFFGCAGGVSIGKNTIFGNYVSLHAENHNIYDLGQPIRLQGVNRLGINIGENCWIGAKVTILDGVKIGNGCVVAAGAVVTKGDYEENSILGGVPAKVISKRKNR